MEALVAAVVALIGQLIAMGQENQAQQLREQMALEYGDEILPEIDAAIAEQAAIAERPEDDAMRRQQLETIAELEQVYADGGMTDADRASRELAQDSVSNRAASRSASLAQDVARRGGGSTNLASALASQSQQDELEALANLEANITSNAGNRGMQALLAKGNMASGVRGDDFRATDARANAMDIGNRFNASQRQQVGLVNQQIPQQQFDNRMGLIGARNATKQGIAAGYERQANNTRQMAGGVGQSIISFGQSQDDDEE